MQAATNGNEYALSMSHSDTSTNRHVLEGHHNISQMSSSSAISGPDNLVLLSSTGCGLQSLNKIHSPEVLNKMSVSASEAVLNDDIAAPEVRTHIRSLQEEVVVLQSMFTQTTPVPEEPRKTCQSVAVQTHFPPDYEPQAYSVITGDATDEGVSYDSDGVRVLRAIGTWTPNYQGTEQFGDQNSQNFVNGSGTVSSPENSMIQQQSVSNSPISAANCMSSTHANDDSGGEHSQDQSGANKQSPGDKGSFVCPVCHKGLARKDKLVIHMRIHTGEKPYVCEVCERAFARRDKLVMHMNKLKHLTPSNIAPLGKRQHHQPVSGSSMTPEKRQDLKLETQEMGSPASSVDFQPAALVQVVHEQPTMTWNCELCGRICMSREEWTIHARSHLDGDSNNFASTSVSSGLSVLTPLSSYQYSGSGQLCVVCRQEYPTKTDLILHLRTHFVGKPELLANHVASLTDSPGVCS